MNALGFEVEKKKVPFNVWLSDEPHVLWTTGITTESFREIWPEVSKTCNWMLSSLNGAVCSMTIGMTRVCEGAMVNLSRRRRLIIFPDRQLVRNWSTLGRGTFESFCTSTSVTVHQPTILWIPIPIASPKAKPSMKSHITVWDGWYAKKASSDWTWTDKLSVWTGISEFRAPGSPKSLIWQSQW